MSTIRITHGSASVEMSSDDFSYGDGELLARYSPRDLVRATVQALKAADFTNFAEAIENGLDREGIAL